MTTPSQHDAVYALAQANGYQFAARLSGLYRSADGGQTWHNTFAALEQGALAATAVVAEANLLLAGVNGAILRSSDSGATWTLTGLATPPPHVVALALSPNFSQDGVALAGTAQDGVFVSNDGGVTWTAWNFGLLDLQVCALSVSPNFKHDQTVWVGTESGLFRSSNGGRGWREVPFPMQSAPVLSVAVDASGVYAGTEQHGLFVSKDHGATWQAVAGVNAAAVNAVQMQAKALWVLCDDQLLQSDDGGQIWQTLDGLPAGSAALCLLPTAAGALVGCADGSLLALA